MECVQIILNAISDGYAYQVQANGESYIFFEHNKKATCVPPRIYCSALQNLAQNKDDYIVWHTCKNGRISPWGVGTETVNLYLAL